MEATWDFDPKAVASALRRLRLQRSYTQADVAERAGLANETISRIESGREPPSLRTAVQLANAFGVPLDDIIGRASQSSKANQQFERDHRQRLLSELVETLQGLPTALLEDLQGIVTAVARGARRR